MIVGCFSWLDCKTGEQIKSGLYKKVYLLIPEKFGGGHITECCYNGYGEFGNFDVWVLVTEWNTGRKYDTESFDDVLFNELREIGIELACGDSNNKKLKYPIKITYDSTAVYEECKYSKRDPKQGCN